MFRTTLCAVALSAVSFVSNAVETLDVLVVFDKNTINNYAKLNSDLERQSYAKQLVNNLNTTSNNSDLGDVIQFNRVATKLWSFTEPVENEYEDIVEINDRYHNYLNDIIASGNPKGILFQLQKAYSADVVIAVLNEGTENIQGLNGIALEIPDQGDPLGFVPRQLQRIAPLGLFFIAAKDVNLDNERLAAHEFGHTVGLYHEPIEKNDNNVDIDHRPGMLEIGAAGMRSDWSPTAQFSTVMVERLLYQKENMYSNKNKGGCGDFHIHSCGNEDSNAVQTIRTFASDINKRGDWYQ